MSLSPGTRIGPYEIAAQIGAGGMGEVYRATDTNLKRDVAIKVLPDAVATDAERLARFQREAEVLAALNHPNIAGIHGLERSDRAIALVMELVEGPTLADRIAQGAIPLDEALAVARQIADALEAAHEQGIIHRDLKPANVKLRPDGTVKVLDFGLAKAMELPLAASGQTMSPTITTPAMTQAGLILGTAAYMSPEQARGKALDRRSDVWAFGCVLYEMLTGRRAFGGDEVSDVFASVLAREPAFAAVPETVPERVRQVLRACLQKDPKQRVRDIGDVRLALEGAFETVVTPAGDAPTAATVEAPRWLRLLPFVATALVVGMAAGAVGWLVARPGPGAVVTWSHVLPEGRFFRNTGRPVLTVAPGGESFVYNATGGLYLRAMGELEDQAIGGTENAVTNPFFSPDGRSIGFFTDGQMRRIAITGGASTALAPASNPWGASWGSDGTILYAQADGVWQVSENGGEPGHLIETAPGEQAHGPQRLPGGEWILFTLGSQTETGRWDAASIVVASPASGERRVIRTGGSDARYLPTGHLVYAFENVLYAVPFDVGRLEETGGPVPVVNGVRRATVTGAAFFDVSTAGTLVYAAGTDAEKRQLVWVDREGRETGIAAPPRAYQYPRISPDGAQVALDVRDEQNDIWIWSLARETLTRLTFNAGLDRTPVWSPDGSRIAYMSGDTGQGIVNWRLANGTGTEEPLFVGQGTWFPTSFDPQGDRIVVLQQDVGTSGTDVAMLEVSGDREMKPLIETSFDELNGEVSPNGRWLAYQSNESGQAEVYVRSFPDVDAGGRWQVSPGGGTRPVWRADGRELFYLIPPGRVMAVSVETADAFSYGNAVELFDGPYVAANILRTFDVTEDGQRFLMIKLAEDLDDDGPGSRQIVVVENWFEELERLAPTE